MNDYDVFFVRKVAKMSIKCHRCKTMLFSCNIDNWLLVIDNWLLVSDNLIIDIFDWHCSQLFKHSNCSPNLVNFSGDKEIL